MEVGLEIEQFEYLQVNLLTLFFFNLLTQRQDNIGVPLILKDKLQIVLRKVSLPHTHTHKNCKIIMRGKNVEFCSHKHSP